MAIVAHILMPDVSQAVYDQIRAETRWIERPPNGRISHVTWSEGEDCHNIDAWESEHAMNTFVAERLGPAMAKLGVTVEPVTTVHPAHEVCTPQSVKLI